VTRHASASRAFAPSLFGVAAASVLVFSGCGGDDINPVTLADASRDGAADALLVDATTSSDASVADAPSDAKPTALRILFVGDSYTYVNDLPGMLSHIAATSGTPPTITTDEVVQGGARLVDQWNNGIAQTRIREGGFTHVVLQGQSQEPALAYTTDVFALYARHFGDLIVAAGAKPTFFVTWARAAGDAMYDPTSGTFVNPDQMQDLLTEAYANAAQGLPTNILACVGEAFRQTLQRYPDIVLHQSDNSHPTVAGTYLAASTFYVALTGNPVPTTADVPSGVTTEDAVRLRDVAKIGTACAAPQVEGSARLYDLKANGAQQDVDGPDGGPPFDFGTAGTAVSNVLYLANLGDAGIGIRDAQIAAPFAWTTGAFPGGTGAIGANAFCATSLAPGAVCLLSVSYTGSTTGLGRLTLELSGAYQASVTRTLYGTSTSRPLLTVSPSPGISPPPTNDGSYSVSAGSGETLPFTLFVANHGGAPAIGLAPGASLDPPFYWGATGSGTFPGGNGTTQVRGVTYDYCAATLGTGDVCVVTANFAPTVPVSQFTSAIDIAYGDALGPISPHASLPLKGGSGDDAGP
jgi:hypothetical protein